MDVIYGLIPGMIIMGLLAVGVLFWAAKSGQFEDMEGEASRILMDDDMQIKPKKSCESDEKKVAEKPSDET